jgi:hypothetical protein
MKGMGYSEDIIDLSPKYGECFTALLHLSEQTLIDLAGTQNKWVYHVDTVATLAAEYNKKRTTKTKQAWMEEKRCLWGDRNKVGRSNITSHVTELTVVCDSMVSFAAMPWKWNARRTN